MTSDTGNSHLEDALLQILRYFQRQLDLSKSRELEICGKSNHLCILLAGGGIHNIHLPSRQGLDSKETILSNLHCYLSCGHWRHPEWDWDQDCWDLDLGKGKHDMAIAGNHRRFAKAQWWECGHLRWQRKQVNLYSQCLTLRRLNGIVSCLQVERQHMSPSACTLGQLHSKDIVFFHLRAHSQRSLG